MEPAQEVVQVTTATMLETVDHQHPRQHKLRQDSWQDQHEQES